MVIKKKNLIPLAGLFSFAFLFVFILIDFIDLSIIQTFYLAYAYIVFFVAIVLFNKRIPKMSIGMMVVYYSVIQAVGIPIAYLLAPGFTMDQIRRGKYLYGIYMDDYVALSLLAVSFILIGMLMGKRPTHNAQIKPQQNRHALHDEKFSKFEQSLLERTFYIVGMTLLVLFAVFMSYNALNGSIPFGNYEQYKVWANSNRIRNYLQIGYWMASIFICACGTKKQIVWGTVLFLIPSAILFLTGNRNDVFFPLLIGLGFYCMRFKKAPKLFLIALLVIIFIISPMIVNVRTGDDIDDVSNSYNGLLNSLGESIFELGGQLHAVSNMFSWMKSGEDYAYGATYILGVLVSLFGKLIPEIRGYFETSRFFLQPRVPTLGFAMSAEVYFNFGIIGVIICYFIIGCYIIKHESCVLPVKQRVVYGFFIFWLLFLVRNIFSYTLVYAQVFFVLYLLVILVQQRLERLVTKKDE